MQQNHSQVRLSDYVIDFLAGKKINDVFLVSGGGIMYLTDSVKRNNRMNYYTNHHEQACAIAAEGYARMKNYISACLATTGPGATNTITGIASAWYDSIPIIILTGQVKKELIPTSHKIRQLAQQGNNIVPMVKNITKYSHTVKNPLSIRYHLEKAFFEAVNGRPGPVLLDIPLDVQSAMIYPYRLRPFIHPEPNYDQKKSLNQIGKVISLLHQAHRPVIIVGNGLRLSRANSELKTLLNKIPAPVLLTPNAVDILPAKHPLLMGIFGPVGQRRANFCLQNADLIIGLGASLNIATTGFNYQSFAPAASKVLVNIDQNELNRKTLHIDIGIQNDVKLFIKQIIGKMGKNKIIVSTRWIACCRYWKKRYPVVIPDYRKNESYVNSYLFFDSLARYLSAYNTLVTGNSLDACGLFQTFRVKNGQRAFTNINYGSMGWDLPASIGACIANKKRVTICVTGDGSIQMNLQELETIKYYHLPIKIFIFNNGGYASIRNTQKTFFKGRLIGADKHSGVSNPNFMKLAAAFNFKYFKIKTNGEMNKIIRQALAGRSPTLTEVMLSYEQERIPRITSFQTKKGRVESKPLHDMYPFLSRKEINKSMNIYQYIK